MTVLIKENVEKSTIWQPVRLRGRFTVPFDMIPPRQVKGEQINSFSPLWPESHFRDAAMTAAKIFVKHMGLRGYQLVSNEGELWVFGPYHSRAWDIHRNNQGDPFGRQAGENLFPEAADYLIIGDFVAKYGKVVEEAE